MKRMQNRIIRGYPPELRVKIAECRAVYKTTNDPVLKRIAAENIKMYTGRYPSTFKKNPRSVTKKRAVKRNPGKVGRPRKTQADIKRKKILTAYKPYVVQMQTKAGGKWFGVGRFDTKSEAVKHATILHNDLKSFAFRVVLL